MNSTLASIAVAVAIALLFGALLGRIAIQWFSGLGLVTALTELRGAFLPFLVAPALMQLTGISPSLGVGVIVGVGQAVSVARWTTRSSGEWSQALVGGLALGRSRAALVSAMTRSRGAVVATVAATTLQVILLEVLLSGLAIPGCIPEGSWGALLWSGTSVSKVLVVGVGTGLVLGTEVLSSFALRRGLRVPFRLDRRHKA